MTLANPDGTVSFVAPNQSNEVKKVASIELAPSPAKFAQPRQRSRVGASFIVLVVFPTALAMLYLFSIAADQYGSRAAFSVRSSEVSPSAEVLGMLTGSASGPAADGQMVYDFLDSQAMVAIALERLVIDEMFNRAQDDPVFRLGDDRSIEALHDHWRRMTDLYFDASTGIVTFEARAFSAEEAKAITTLVIAEATRLVNELSAQARHDAMKFAAAELDEAETRLRHIRGQIQRFRQVELEIDPKENARASMDLASALEGELAQTKIRLNTMRSVLSDNAPRVRFLEEKISNLEQQIAAARARIGTRTGADDQTTALADLMAEFDALELERSFAETAYTSSLTLFEQARAEARRQIRYLAVHIAPTLSEASQYPKRGLLAAGVFGLLSMAWLIGLLLLYNIRGRV